MQALRTLVLPRFLEDSDIAKPYKNTLSWHRRETSQSAGKSNPLNNLTLGRSDPEVVRNLREGGSGTSARPIHPSMDDVFEKIHKFYK